LRWAIRSLKYVWRIWPYCGDKDHPVILYDYTATREHAGPEEFLKGYRGHLQADAYGGYDAFFKDPARGLIEILSWAFYWAAM
jgi:transposase